MSQRIDRRKFLLGTAGASLALPLLEFFAPRRAFAQVASSPKRLVLVLHSHGRTVGNGGTVDGVPQDNWSPARTTGPLPAGMSPLLAGLEPIRNELVTVDGVDNIVRHATLHGDGHYSAERTCLTCKRPKADGSGGGPSIDFVLGQRLRASTNQRASVVIAGDSAAYDYHFGGDQFYGPDGTPPTRLRLDPETALTDLFGPVSTDTMPSLRQRLEARRGTLLNDVNRSFSALRGKVSAADRERLDAHAEFIRSLQQQSTGGTQGCSRPVAPVMDLEAEGGGGRLNGTFTPFQVKMLVQALACDVLRVAALHFHQAYDPVFNTEFSGTSPYESRNYHDAVHSTSQLSASTAANLTTAYGFYTKTFTQLVQGLAAIQEPDGSRLLDNTLVLWVSDLGYGSAHHDFNIPVVLAGLKSAFPQGQGRHVVMNRHSLGDLYAHVLRMFGGTETTFGETGTLASVTGTSDLGDLNSWAGAGGWGGHIQGSTPLHKGPLDF